MPNVIIISTVNTDGLELEVAVFLGYISEDDNREKVLECTKETLIKAMNRKDIARVRVSEVSILRDFKAHNKAPADIALVKNLQNLSIEHARAVESIDYFLDRIREEHLP